MLSGIRCDGGLLRRLAAQVDDGYAEVLAQGVGEVALVQRAELDEQGAEPLARDPLLDQGLGQLGRRELLPLDEDLAQQPLARVRRRRSGAACAPVSRVPSRTLLLRER